MSEKLAQFRLPFVSGGQKLKFLSSLFKEDEIVTYYSSNNNKSALAASVWETDHRTQTSINKVPDCGLIASLSLYYSTTELCPYHEVT